MARVSDWDCVVVGVAELKDNSGGNAAAREIVVVRARNASGNKGKGVEYIAPQSLKSLTDTPCLPVCSGTKLWMMK